MVATNQHDTIQAFIQGTVADGAPVLPISAQLKYNVDAVCEYIVKKIPIPVRDFTSPPQMIVIRSFDVNKPGSEVAELQGGVAGGSILQVRCLLFLYICFWPCHKLEQVLWVDCFPKSIRDWGRQPRGKSCICDS